MRCLPGQQGGAEWLVARLERLLRELDAPVEVTRADPSQVTLGYVDLPFLLAACRAGPELLLRYTS